jgi:hypothetical protein
VIEKFLYTVSHSNGERKRKTFTAKTYGVKSLIIEKNPPLGYSVTITKSGFFFT